jgi:hypothetical protein
VENGEYAFCNDNGQRYRGELIRPAGFFKAEEWRLVPEGTPELKNALAIVDRATDVEVGCSVFSDLESLRQHLTSRCR